MYVDTLFTPLYVYHLLCRESTIIRLLFLFSIKASELYGYPPNATALHNGASPKRAAARDDQSRKGLIMTYVRT
jgi:hypothetical protein